MNDQVQGIILGIIFTLIIILITASIVVLAIYKFQPGFICDLCPTRGCELIWLPNPSFN